MPQTAFAPAALLILLATAAAVPSRAAPPAQPAAPARAQVRFDLRLTRSDSPSAPAAAEAASADAAASASAPAPAPNAPAAAAGPVTVAAPILNTTDLGTASIAVTNADLGFTVSLSPTLESAEKSGTKASILTLWNLRLSGRSLPGGTSVVTVTGSTRVAPGTEATLAEVPLRDAKTGQTSLFRLVARATITAPGAAAPGGGAAPAAALSRR